MNDPPNFAPDGAEDYLVRKLASYDALTEEERRVLAQAAGGFRRFDAGQDIATEDTRPGHSAVLVEGWAARSKSLANGARQITSLHIPGDFVDLHSFLLHKLDHNVVALTACRLAVVPHEKLKRITDDYPHLTRLLWLNTLVDAGIHRTWIVGMGRMSAPAHMAQLVCELYVRLQAVGLAGDHEFEFPLSQPVVADALGLSLVHVSRALREIRTRGLIDWRARAIRILDWDALATFAQFDPTYLSQRREPR